MSRARATALALVNWRGVFYERYLLDRHVTALEGSNGAGKTTVMIGAYVVLLPDLSRLRFTNLGESGATGGDKGIWGRLGEGGRPSYAALEIELASGERVVAGVHLERKAEPSLDLTTFLISGLSVEGSLREVLLSIDADHESVPELSEVRAAVTERGGRLQIFATTKEYFAALFELGVSPLRMATDEDRNKLNDLLRTSMTGGISRALTSELRSFLFREETGLGDALARMRGNLDACHRTRLEVAEARRLEHEIAAVFETGQSMFAASMFAARATAAELGQRAAEAAAVLEDSERMASLVDGDAREAAARHAACIERRDLAREAHERARAEAEIAARASAVAERLAEVDAESVRAGEVARRARDDQAAAHALRERQRNACEAARDACDRAATGLADLQAGLGELHRNAHDYRHVRSQLDRARELLGDRDIDAGSAGAIIEAVTQRLAVIDSERAAIHRDRETAAVRRDEHARAVAALEKLVGAVEPARQYEQARSVLAHLLDLESLQSRGADLEVDLGRATVLADRQRAVRGRAAVAGFLPAGGASASKAVEQRLAAAELAVRAAEHEALALETDVREARRAKDEARLRARQLGDGAARFRELSAMATHLGEALGAEVRSGADVAAARATLAARRESISTELAHLRERRDFALRRAASLGGASSDVHPDLLRLRDELDAEFLSARYEDLDLEEASRVEALLGPLADALVVTDPAAAAKQIVGGPRDVSTVWLVPSGTEFASDRGALIASAAGDQIVEEGGVFRVSRIAASPTLGRRARAKVAGGLRTDAEQLGAEIEARLEAGRKLDALARAADTLAITPAVLEAGDPAALAAAALQTERDAEADEQRLLGRIAALRAQAAAERPKIDALRPLLGEAYLLDPPDHSERVRSLRAQVAAAGEAARELARAGDARRVLAELADSLRTPPGHDDAEGATARIAILDRSRESLFLARDALSDVLRGKGALRFADAERDVSERSAVVPALEAQLVACRDALRSEEAASQAGERAWEVVTLTRQKAEAALEAARAHGDRLRAELDALAASFESPGSSSGAYAARVSRDEREAELRALELDERAFATRSALLDDRRAQSERALGAARARFAQENEAKGPLSAAWERARDAAEVAGVLASATSPRFADIYAARPSAALWPEARSRAELLVERLQAARGATDAIALLRAAIAAAAEDSSQSYLSAWVCVRDWVRRRLPAQVADVAEPLDALGRLHDDLGGLEQRLSRHEIDLRGASEDVARGIEVQLRRAKNQVRRLNQQLAGVTFGSIAAIRVQMRRIERMDQVLRALQEGVAQELLFLPGLPIEEALDEIFRRYGGGKSGGQRILDYREYVELAVEIRRQSTGEWESASPTRLSTGEAIGVGAALMMVILTEWERDANLLRHKRASGSLRFLFLDEANRLSQDNLGVLFDLCKTLDLQLLIAAPEVARAEGNTTYRLVRRVTQEGREEVLVSGRRTVAMPQQVPPAGDDEAAKG